MLGAETGWGSKALGGRLDRLLFNPETLPPDAALALALVPPVLAGVIFFRLPALVLLGLAIAVGGSFHLAARILRQPLAMSPLVAALVGVALCGPGAPPAWALAVALAAAVLEVLRGRLLPTVRVHSGLLAYGAVFVAGDGAAAAYLRPAGMLPFPEPIQQWSRFYGGDKGFLDPATLYVGNVAGPVFATSLLAVAISLAWLWYARRISLSALAGFLAGGAAVAAAAHWDPRFQLESGPAWFVAGLVLADRRLLPAAGVGSLVLGLAAGAIGIGLRASGVYVEGCFLTVAALQVGLALLGGAVSLVARGRRRRAPARPPVRKEPASA